MEKYWIELWKLKISGLSSDPVGASQGSMQMFMSTVRSRLLAPSGIIKCIACLYWHVSCKVWYEDTCQCGCARTDSAAKHYCALDANRQWSDETCSCVCKVRRHVDLETGVKHIVLQMTCPHATELDPDTCTCGEGVSQCAVSPLYSVTGTVTGSHPAKVATYVGLVAIALVTLTILVTLYLMATKKRPYTDLRYPSRWLHIKSIQ